MGTVRAIVLSTVLLAPWGGQAALEWENDYQEFERKVSDGFLEVRFGYRNAGAAPVIIKNVEASCNCTTAEVTRPVVNPGETGELRAVFTFGKRVGLQRKAIVVETDDNQVKELRFQVKIADRVKVEPASLVWKKDSPEVQSVMVYAQDGYVIPQIRAIPTDSRLSATVRTIKPGEVYEVAVSRKEGAFAAKLRVETGHGTPQAGVKVIPVTVE